MTSDMEEKAEDPPQIAATSEIAAMTPPMLIVTTPDRRLAAPGPC